MYFKRVFCALLIFLPVIFLTACEFPFTLPFINHPDEAEETAASNEDATEMMPTAVKVPPVYVTIALHLEDVPGYANCQLYPDYREKLLEFASAVAPYKAAINLQSDYEFLLGVTRCETPSLQELTNGQNVIDYLVDQYGYEIDAHQQGGWDFGGKDNYADIRWLAGELTTGVSETMGGLVFDDPVQWKSLAEGQKGLQFANFTWKPQALTLAVDSTHRLGDFSADDFACGVWIPSGTGSDFWTHNPQGQFIYIGPGEYDNWNNKHGKRSTPDFVRDLLVLLEKGELDPELIYTATLAVPQSIIFNSEEHQKLLELLEQLAPLAEEGKIMYANYSEIVEIWQQQYGSRPNIYFKDGITDYVQNEEPVAQQQDLPTLKPGENVLKIINPSSKVSLYVAVYIPEIWNQKSGLPTLVLVPGGTGNSRGFIKENPGGISMVSAINDAGMVAVVFDPDGRGLSSGVEDHGGYTQQDGLAAVVRYIAALPAVAEDKIGMATFSYGITMGSGALARHRDLPIQFLIDWEGPANRDDTGGCDEHNIGHLGTIAVCDDESFWKEREAATFVEKIIVPYQRIQGVKDHVQPDQAHTILMINNAVKGSCPWVRLNDETPNQTYLLETIPFKPLGDSRKPVEALVVRYATELFGPPQSKCGDGVCDPIEKDRGLCPEDCRDLAPKQETTKATRPIVYIGIMVHLEGWADDTNESAYVRHVSLMRDYADLFEAYDAKLTWESKELTKGSLRWGDNVLLEMQERGHGVGVHADVGGSRNYVCKNFTSDLTTKKKELEQLGINVRHVSGVTSHCDWVTACVESGFKFTTGGVAYSVSSLPEELQPDQFKNCPSPSKCHQPYPTSLAERLHPWRAKSGADWIIDNPSGKLVILSESGLLVGKYEQSMSPDGSYVSSDFTKEDIDTYIQELEQAIALADPDKVNIYYVGWSLGKPLDKVLLEQWLKRIEPYVEDGSVKWVTLPEMYDAYIMWEQENR